MARQYKIPYQNLTFTIPEVGEIFRTDDDYGVYKLTDKGVISYDVGGEGRPKQGEREKLINEAIGQDRGSLTKYNMGDLRTALQKMGAFSSGLKSVNDVSLFKPTPVKPSGEVITQSISPVNPHGVDVTSSLQGTLAKSPSLEENLQKAMSPDKYEFSRQMAAMPKSTTEADKPIQQIGDLSKFGTFDRQLQFGSTGEDVKRLQQFLNEAGFIVAKEGAGSIGNETEYFGPATQKALQEYQKSQGIVSTGDPTTTGYGRLGPQTLKSVNTLISPETTEITEDKGYTPITSKTLAQDDTGTKTTITDSITPDISQQIKDTETEEDIDLETILSGSTATDEQKDIIRSMFSAVSSFDKDLMERLSAGFDAAEKLQEPYFRAQIRLAKDELARGFTKLEDTLAFEEESLTRTLEQLREDTALAKERGSLEEQTQLAQLEKALGLKLEDTRQNLATSGFTSSSRRARSEELLRETTGEMRESTERKFAQKREDLATGLKRGETGTQAELERLRDVTKKGKLSLGREKEAYLGSKEVSGLGFNLLGDISGTLTKERQEDVRKFARSFIN